jgi:hypothetical protein
VADVVIENPILNSPYDEPSRHFRFLDELRRRCHRRAGRSTPHTPELFAGTEVVEFSPTEELKKTLEVALKNAEG